MTLFLHSHIITSFTWNMLLFPDNKDATVDLPTPRPPTIDTNVKWVLNSGTSPSLRNLSLASSAKNPSSLLESFDRLKLISQIAAGLGDIGSVHTWTSRFCEVTSPYSKRELILPWHAWKSILILFCFWSCYCQSFFTLDEHGDVSSVGPKHSNSAVAFVISVVTVTLK